MAKKKKKAKPRKTAKKKKKPAAKAKKRKQPAVPVYGIAGLHGVVTERVPCGCTTLDAIMGGPLVPTENGFMVPARPDGTTTTAWGLPVGRISEVIGGYSTSKSSFLESLAVQVQKLGGDVAMGITEAVIDPIRMRRVGCDLDRIRFNEFEYLEEGFEWLQDILEAREDLSKLLLVTWDTIGGAHPEDTRPGSGSRVVREGLRKISNLVARKRALVVFANQVAVTFDRFATEPATPFGAGVRFHASVRLEFRGRKRYVQKDSLTPKVPWVYTKAPIGISPIAQCLKNNTFPPFRRCRIPVLFDGPFDDDYSIYQYLEKCPRIMKVDGEKVQFKMPEPATCKLADFRQFLVERPDVKEWLKYQCYNLAYQGYDPIA